ncbi:hypothetical protein [Solitalea lacus]|uniref:hypothetical protein n=1 Tax=Solitalea lacus TaxID=2911172 RepID=UPI001EDA0396|nr:hypothetical protein [Solitalea lacus]UKJ06500.1 hypothetical protein L2B55_13265 [Solitalea lacus]
MSAGVVIVNPLINMIQFKERNDLNGPWFNTAIEIYTKAFLAYERPSLERVSRFLKTV